QTRSNGDDVKKRLMVVPDVHVTRLVTGQRNGATVVTAVLLKQFGVEQSVPVPDDGIVIVALGTIESTRLALISFPSLSNSALIGQNLMAHLRSNLTIRIPRSALPAGLPNAMDEAADDVAKVFANGQPYEVFEPPQGTPKQIHVLQPADLASSKLPFAKRRDNLGTTHHEAGSLWMGTDPNDSVTNEDARF